MSLAARLEALSPHDVGLPGPTSAQMARDFRSVRSDPLSFLTDATEKFGDRIAFPVPGAPAIFFNDPDDVRHILQTSARSWGKNTVQYSALGRVTGDGLLASAAPGWIEHRRIAAPAFHHERLRAISTQVRTATADVLRTHLGDDRPGGAVVDVSTLMHRIALDAVGRALFSADLTPRAEELLNATGDAAELVVRVGRSVLPSAAWMPTPTNVRVRSTRRRLIGLASEIVRRRRTRPADEALQNDLLGLLLDSGMDEQHVVDELITMVIAGHETVAAALSWTCMMLSEHPQIQDSVRTELSRLDDVSMLTSRQQAPWTKAVIDESLRLYPPAWALSRRAIKPDVVAGLALPAGTLAIISPWVMHRHQRVWTDPERFDPRRFIDRDPPRAGYLPFGQGPRLCIGRDFALGEMVVVLNELLAEYELSLPANWRRPAPQTRVAVHPHGGMPLQVKRIRHD